MHISENEANLQIERLLRQVHVTYNAYLNSDSDDDKNNGEREKALAIHHSACRQLAARLQAMWRQGFRLKLIEENA